MAYRDPNDPRRVKTARKAALKYHHTWAKQHPEENRTRSHKWAIEHPEQYLLQGARRRSKAKGLDLTIEVSDIQIPEVCPLLGIPIVKGSHAPARKGGPTPNSPTLDRKDPSKGYVKGNVWVISWRANKLKSDATLEELEKMVAVLRAHRIT